MTLGSASRSNRRRTPATRCTSPSIAGRCARRRSACSLGTFHTSITPGAPSMSTVRRYTLGVEIDRLDAGDRARREEREQLVPRERRRGTGRAARARRRPRAGRAARRLARSSLGVNWNTSCITRFIWRTLLNPAAAASCAIGRSVSSSSRRGEVRAARTGDLARRRADVLGEQAAQVARAHAEARREVVFGRAVERAVGDAAHRAAHELGRRDPTRLGRRDRDGSAGTAGSRRPRPRPRARTAACCGAAACAGQPGAAIDAGGDDAGEVPA